MLAYERLTVEAAPKPPNGYTNDFSNKYIIKTKLQTQKMRLNSF